VSGTNGPNTWLHRPARNKGTSAHARCDVEESRSAIDAFCRYAHDQGVTQRRMTAEELFPREVRGMARV